MRVPYEEMVNEFARVLEKKGFQREDAENAAVIFAQNSLAGVFSHGLNRFPRVVSYLEKGEIDPDAAGGRLSVGILVGLIFPLFLAVGYFLPALRGEKKTVSDPDAIQKSAAE